MKKHVKVWCDYHGIGEQDNPLCQYCYKRPVVDIHHIELRSQLGKDNIENLIGLCRECHNLAHENKITKQQLYDANSNGKKNKCNMF